MFSEVNGEPVELSSIIDVRDGTHDSPKAQATGYYLITSKHLLPFGVDKASANRISKADFDKINERSRICQRLMELYWMEAILWMSGKKKRL